jgi:hypothetical protein
MDATHWKEMDVNLPSVARLDGRRIATQLKWNAVKSHPGASREALTDL